MKIKWHIIPIILLCMVILGRVKTVWAENGYPYNADAGVLIEDRWGFYQCESTSYCAYRLNTTNGVYFHNTNSHGSMWGDANHWDDFARNIGIKVDNSPAVGAIAYWDSGSSGHVAWVRSVNYTTITIEEYNYGYVTLNGKSYGSHKYNTRNISSLVPTGYIHIKDISLSSIPKAPEQVRTVTGRTTFKESENIQFSWTAVSNAADYRVYMWKDGVELYGIDVGNTTSFTSAPASTGNYTLIVRAGNSSGYSIDGAQISFKVLNKVPEAPKNVSTSDKKTVYTTNDSISFNWDKVSDADDYWVYMWKDGEEIYNSDVGDNTSHTAKPLAVGQYTLFVRAGNCIGYSDGGDAQVKFVVTNKAPEVPKNVRTSDGKFAYTINDSVSFIWDKVSDADDYWVYIWKDGEEIFLKDVGSNTSYTADKMEEGQYTFIVKAGNKIGFSNEGAQILFEIHNKKHSYKEKVIQAPTCTQKGTRLFSCECGSSYTEDIPATGHQRTEVRGAAGATCTADGYTGDTWCTDCETKIGKGSVIPKLNHAWNNGKITRKATYDEEGEKLYTCTVCGEKKTEILPKLAPKRIKKGSKFSDPATGNKYKVVLKGKTVSFITPKKNAKSIVIPDTVRYKGVTYKVTVIGANACKKNKAITTVSIGANVKTVSKNAFYGCPNLKKIVIPAKVSSIGKSAFKGCRKLADITIKTKKLTSKNVGANAFTGTSAKAVVKVPKSKLKAYKKWLYTKGLAETATVQ